MEVKAFGLTHVGRQRQHNEDSYLVRDDAGLYLVADGMGGHAAGEIASRIAAESVLEHTCTGGHSAAFHLLDADWRYPRQR